MFMAWLAVGVREECDYKGLPSSDDYVLKIIFSDRKNQKQGFWVKKTRPQSMESS